IDSGPAGSVPSNSASLGFGSDEPGASFECRLDGGPFGGCASPQEYSDLPVGEHTFEVRAIDGVGNVDGSPASWTWTIAPALDASAFAPACRARLSLPDRRCTPGARDR